MLETLAELPKKVDEDIHRGYSRLTKKWEDKFGSKYDLSLLFDLSSLGSMYWGSPNANQLKMGYDSILAVLSPLMSVSGATSVYSLVYHKLGRRKKGEGVEHAGITRVNDKFIVENPLLWFTNKISKTVRAPELILGASFIGKGVFDLGNYFIGNDSSSLSEGLGNLGLGVSMASNASAWYVRDSDPKVLEKKPNWKAGLEKLANAISPAQTEPSPIKIPVKY